MAISKNGFFSHPSGKIGPVVFYNLNGQIVSRTIGALGPPTKKQLANRQAMAAAMKVLVPLQELIKLGFAAKAKGTTCNAFNLATSHAKKQALKGEYPNISIDYSKVLLSSGSLSLANNINMTKTDRGILLSWDPKTKGMVTNGNDQVMVAVYHPTTGIAEVNLNAAKREDGSCFIAMEYGNQLDEPIETYLCFRSADGERVSDSIYAGNLNGAMQTEQQQEEKVKYEAVKAHFDKIETLYIQQKNLTFESGLKNKSFRHLEKEYKMLKVKLENLPGKFGL